MVNNAICEGDSILVGGAYQITSGTYYDTVALGNNCDSITITELTVMLKTTYNLNESICKGDSVLLQGNYQTFSGIYYDTFYGYKNHAKVDKKSSRYYRSY